jgi:hypothetical protein
MNIRTSLVLPAVICMAFPAFALFRAHAEPACDENTVRDRLAELEDAFRQSDVQAKLAAAKKDWLDDEDFDSDENAKYLGTVAAYHDMKRNVDAGAIDGACESLIRTDALVRTVLGDL